MALQQNGPSFGAYPPVSIENILSSVYPNFFYTDKNSVLIEEDEDITSRYTVKIFSDSIHYTLQYNTGRGCYMLSIDDRDNAIVEIQDNKILTLLLYKLSTGNTNSFTDLFLFLNKLPKPSPHTTYLMQTIAVQLSQIIQTDIDATILT